MIFFAQPQGTNNSSEFIKAICLAVSACSFLVFLNFSVDGVSVESKDVRRTICEFFSGKVSYLALVDPNHIYKAVQYQIFGGSPLTTIGDWVLDSSLLIEAGVIQDLWCPFKFTSYLLVLQLFSMGTMDKLVSYYNQNSDEVSCHNIIAIVVTLYFFCMHLYAVNSDHVNA